MVFAGASGGGGDGTCSLWHYNQSFVYEFNGTNFKPGFDYAIGYFWRMQGSLPPRRMSLQAAIEYARRMETDAIKQLRDLLDGVESSLPEWQSRARGYRDFAKFLNEVLQDPNIQAIIQNANAGASLFTWNGLGSLAWDREGKRGQATLSD